MNCRQFNRNIVELLKGDLESSKRCEALAHALACTECGAILAAQQHLTAGLHALAAEQAHEKASPRVEQQLLAAFREHSADRGLQISGKSRQLLIRKWWLWGTAAAGVLLAALVFHGLLHHPRPTVVKTAPEHRLAEPTDSRGDVRPSGVPQTADARSSNPISQRSRAVERIRSRRFKTRPPATLASDPPEPVVAEVATDFYVIPYSEPVRVDEGMRVVRTDVPRSSLAAFGLPVSDERAFDPIQADVLVGEDNVARAIRFVREWRLPPPRSGPVQPARVKKLHAQQEP